VSSERADRYLESARYDFHIHSHCSDGARSPAELLDLAARRGVQGISITDHDTVDAYAHLPAPAVPGAPRVLPAIEISAVSRGIELHILAYFPGGLPEGLHRLADRLLSKREERIREGLARLVKEKGIRLAWEDVRAESRGRAISRGHLAQALVRRKYIPSIAAAFPNLLGPEMVLPPDGEAREMVEEVLRLGGIPVLAHPSLANLTSFLDELVAAGLRGIELHTPRRRPADRERIEALAKGRGLLVTGGSDWHGHEEGKSLGDFTVGRAEVGEFLAAIGWD